MKEKILHDLVLASRHLAHAEHAGAPRQAVTDGYLTVDVSFSALLAGSAGQAWRDPDDRLDKIRYTFGADLKGYIHQTEAGASYPYGVPWDDVLAFRQEFLQAQGEVFEMNAGQVFNRVLQAKRVFEFALDRSATTLEQSAKDLRTLIDVRVFGVAEQPLYNKFSDTSNEAFAKAGVDSDIRSIRTFSDMELTASDPTTREIIQGDTKMAVDFALIHVRLVQFMEHVRRQRRQALLGQGRPAQIAQDEEADFMCALLSRYQGQKQSDFTRRFAEAIGVVLDG